MRFHPQRAQSMNQYPHREGRTRLTVELTRSAKSQDQSHRNESATARRIDRKEKPPARQQSCVFPASDGKTKPSSGEDSRSANSLPRLRGAAPPPILPSVP